MTSFTSLLATTLLLFTTCSPTQAQQGYTIKGTVMGLPDSTWLYLRTNEPFDSCQVFSGQFTMSGRLAEPAKRVLLHTRGFTNYVSFWLENTHLSLSLQAGGFKQGRISGSATQDESKRLAALHKPIDHLIDSLDRYRQTIKDPVLRKELLTQRQQLAQRNTQIDTDWIKAHPGSLFATELLNTYATSWGVAMVQPLYDHLSAAMKASQLGQEVKQYLAVYRGGNIGDQFLDFEQPNPAGRLVKLSEAKGKYTLVDFWASWCGPCLEETPVLKEIYGRYKDQGFTVVAVSLDNNKAAWLKAIEMGKTPWENVTDLRGAKNVVALTYGINGIPDNFLLDEKGIIIARGLHGKALDDKLRQLLP
ncbi:redoxin domain-containing protein [Fibrella aquatica]|jgi:thiol-disulfide isomerase/thioredoxin|uniref:redoxin domain-containing protein n=1 Tax=Fibrella aquatica TaxID=3242487 RepID=UPI003522E059